jgi:hypothetical protein
MRDFGLQPLTSQNYPGLIITANSQTCSAVFTMISQSHKHLATGIQSAQKNNVGGQQHIFQTLQCLRKLCNYVALVLKGDTRAINVALRKIGNKTDKLSNICHAPKLFALR